MEEYLWTLIGILAVFLALLLYKYITKKEVEPEKLVPIKHALKEVNTALTPSTPAYHALCGAILSLEVLTGEIKMKEYEEKIDEHIEKSGDYRFILEKVKEAIAK